MKPTQYQDIPKIFRKQKLSILLPFLNEEEVIVANTGKVLDISSQWDIEVEILLIDDGSTDRSYELLREAYKNESRVILVRNHQNFGKGWALKTGYEYSTGDLVLFLDSDLELSPRHLPNFLRVMEEEGSDLVIGSKRHPESELDYPLKRKIMSNVYYIVIRLLFGLPVKDTQTGIKLFKREALEIALPRMLVKRFAFDIELLLLMHKYKQKIAIAPIELNFSRVAAGRMKLKTVFNMLWDTFSIFYRNTLLRFYDREVGSNERYSYTFILFSHKDDAFEKTSLERYLSVNYDDYEVIYCGPKDLKVHNKRLKYIASDAESFVERFQLILERVHLTSDYLVFSTLDTYPDDRYLFPAGRLLSLPEVAGVGGFVTYSRPFTEAQMQSFLSLRSVYLSAHLAFRYKAKHTRGVGELPLEGLILRRDGLEGLDWDKHVRLEHLLCQYIKAKGQKLMYVPDLMLYKRFPDSLSRLFGIIRHHAWTRGRLHSSWALLALLAALTLDAGVVLSIVQKNVLWALPAMVYFGTMFLSRTLLFGLKRGPVNTFILIISQFLYSIYFIGGFFSLSKKDKNS